MIVECISKTGVNLGEVLAKKSRIKFCVDNGIVWYTTIVESVDNNQVTIAFPEMFAAVDVILGDTVKCRFWNEDAEYSFEANIESLKIYFPQQINLRLIGQVEKCNNVRKWKREESLLLANVFRKDRQEGLVSCVRDVSKTGIKVTSKFFIKAGEDVDVHISLPLRNIFDNDVRLKGKVMWSKVALTHNEYGIEITDIHDTYKSRMQQFMETYTA